MASPTGCNGWTGAGNGCAVISIQPGAAEVTRNRGDFSRLEKSCALKVFYV